MGRITTNVGLLSGIDITGTVDQLISLSAQPRDRLEKKTSKLQSQQTAVTELTAALLGVQYATRQIGKSSIFQARSVSSSNSTFLSASSNGSPAVGEYRFTPAQTAQKHQILSSGFAATDKPIGEGVLRLGFDGFVDEGLDLDLLNGGKGIAAGKIKLTDRAGQSATIDLRFALTVDDVLAAINNNDDIDIQAETVGDSFRLVDTSQGTGNLRVQEVGSGSTAADLGLAGINVASDTAVGADVVSLSETIAIDQLNDGAGLSIRTGLPDLSVKLADGQTISIDFQPLDADAPNSLGDLIKTINEASPGNLEASLSESGDRLVLTDLTSGASTFAVTSPLSGSVAEDLGLTGTAVAGEITSERLLGPLKGPLLSSLSGGAGLGQLGEILIQDRSGNSATVDLSSADSLNAVLETINNAGLQVTAQVNQARNGITLVDTSGQLGNLIVESSDATDTAAKLGIAVNASVASIKGGSLNLQSVSEHTTLDSLNGGRGVSKNSFLITDASGKSSAVNLSQLGDATIGGLISAINELPLGVRAEINETGDGLQIVDTLGAGAPITISEVGSGTAAADLNLLGAAVQKDFSGQPTYVIDGRQTIEIEIDADDTLQDLADKVNALRLDVTASLFSDGSGVTPNRLSILSNVGGKQGTLLVDAHDASFSFQTLTEGRDALLLFGEGDGILTSSSTNTFNNLVDGLSLTVNQSSEVSVGVTVAPSDNTLVSQMKAFVDQYNKLRDKIDSITFFNESDLTTGVLFGSPETLRIESDLTQLVSSRYFGAGSIRSVGEVGISIGNDGQLTLDETRLREKFAADPEAVEEFFTNEEFGLSAKFEKTIDGLAGEGKSLLLTRLASLQTNIDNNTDRVEFLTDRLEKQRELLLTKFYKMEEAIAKMQSNLSSIASIAPLSLNQ
ncbi:flagellar filament capping protein FliD [Lignipirellula cremea]|uniref:Filament cap protein n=1 Tax=Lignipirellula cremea TaxID=2528010 RepID=A0A518DSL7_9BACT|nr:flagellar filament capping protein FliD [Lignipirellula cremea]QDU94836.1 Flagellar hook-associated protein 2 [Lignipirellula cremea]